MGLLQLLQLAVVLLIGEKDFPEIQVVPCCSVVLYYEGGTFPKTVLITEIRA